MTHTYCLHTATMATAAWAGAQARDISLALPAEPWDARLRWPAWTCCQPCLPCPEATKEARGHWAQAWVSTHSRACLRPSQPWTCPGSALRTAGLTPLKPTCLRFWSLQQSFRKSTAPEKDPGTVSRVMGSRAALVRGHSQRPWMGGQCTCPVTADLLTIPEPGPSQALPAQDSIVFAGGGLWTDRELCACPRPLAGQAARPRSPPCLHPRPLLSPAPEASPGWPSHRE